MGLCKFLFNFFREVRDGPGIRKEPGKVGSGMDVDAFLPGSRFPYDRGSGQGTAEDVSGEESGRGSGETDLGDERGSDLPGSEEVSTKRPGRVSPGGVGGGVLMSDREIQQHSNCPNCSERTADIQGMVIHYTAGGNYQGSVDWFMNPDSKVSAHYVIGREGQIAEVVAPELKAWHAGGSQLYEHTDVNNITIGIELANWGLLTEIEGKYYADLGGTKVEYNMFRYPPPEWGVLKFDEVPDVEGYWEPYSTLQLDATHWLCNKLSDKYGITFIYTVGHSDIAVPQGRKTDPGPLFPWDDLRRAIA